MIAHLNGTVAAVGPTWAVLDVGGVGYHLTCTPETVSKLRVGQPGKLATALVVREDSMTLFGFSDATERETFEMVQSTSGIGPKTAMAVLSVLSPAALVAAIQSEDFKTLTKVPGIGRKGAERMVIELRDKVIQLGVEPDVAPVSTGRGELWRSQVAEGLMGLGWSARDAEAACDGVAPMIEADPNVTIATLLKAALRSLAH